MKKMIVVLAVVPMMAIGVTACTEADPVRVSAGEILPVAAASNSCDIGREMKVLPMFVKVRNELFVVAANVAGKGGRTLSARLKYEEEQNDGTPPKQVRARLKFVAKNVQDAWQGQDNILVAHTGIQFHKLLDRNNKDVEKHIAANEKCSVEFSYPSCQESKMVDCTLM